MKIEDVVSLLVAESRKFEEGALAQVTWLDAAAQVLKQKNVLEQHHKDLMGLVSEWRKRLVSDDDMDYKEGFYEAMQQAASNLESLINPKD